MLVRITGTVAEVETDAAVLERDGLAREVLIPGYALGELTACRGRRVTLHTLEFLEGNQASGHLTPRLLGFPRAQDREFFRRFVSVKGIGPRKALKALSEPVVRVARWIEQGDRKSLATLPGIGKRAAELIVAELKGKLEAWALGGAEPAPESNWTEAQHDAIEIMVAWGDNRADAQRWLARAAQTHPDVDSTDEWVRSAYKIKTGSEN
ncbi:MAG: Holliday junction branch migration protein RuvA [Phycisphaerae bacterium]